MQQTTAILLMKPKRLTAVRKMKRFERAHRTHGPTHSDEPESPGSTPLRRSFDNFRQLRAEPVGLRFQKHFGCENSL